MKICNVCNIKKELSDFRVRKNGDYRHQCKKCENNYQKSRRIKLKPIVEKEKEVIKQEKHTKVIQQFIGKESEYFIVTKYDGYYPPNKKGYPRHHFTKQCKFCNNTITQPKSRMELSLENNSICMVCEGTYNVHTKQKKCSCCQIWKDATNDNFVKSKNRAFGLNYYCKECQNSKSRKRRESKEVRQKEQLQRKTRSENDSLFKLTCNIRVLIRAYIRRVNITKTKSKCKTKDILGCDFFEFKEYIEKQFVDGMSWDNHGKWHLDHIVPVSLGVNEDEVIELCHYTNYQPLWAVDNQIKNNKVLLDTIPDYLKQRYSKIIERKQI